MKMVAPGKQHSAAKSSGFRDMAAYRFTLPLVQLLAKTSISPTAITVFGFLLALVAAVLIAMGYLFAAGFVMLVAALFDMVDGALARYIARTTRFGAVLDSTLDRLSEAALLIAVLFFYAREQSPLAILLVALALTGSLLVSYVRARAEGMGIEGKGGFFTRAERVIVLAVGLLLSRFDNALLVATGIIAVLSFITAGQRLFSVWQQTKNG